MKGFLPIPKDGEWLTLTQFIKLKRQHCEWRLSKRRSRDADNNFLPRNWLGRCVSCSNKHIENAGKYNAKAKQTRQRIKQDEIEFQSGKIVEINSLDIVVWKLFAEMKKIKMAAIANGENFDTTEALRKIAAHPQATLDLLN